MISATFDNLGSSISVQFDSITNKAKKTGEFNCGELFEDAKINFGDDNYCIWASYRELSIYVSRGSQIVDGEDIYLLENPKVPILSVDETSGPSYGSTEGIFFILDKIGK